MGNDCLFTHLENGEETPYTLPILLANCPEQLRFGPREYTLSPNGGGGRMDHDDHPPTPDDAGDGGSNREEKALFAAQLESMANTVGALAREVQAMKAQPAGSEPALGPRLFAESTGLGGSVDAEEALRRARAAAGAPPEGFGERKTRQPALSFAPERAPNREKGAVPHPLQDLAAGREFSQAPWDRVATLMETVLRDRDRDEDLPAETGLSSGVKGIEKMTKSRDRMRDHPGERYRHVMEVVRSQLRNENTRNLESYVQHHTHMNRDRLTLSVASLFCEVLRAAEEGDAPRVKDLACSGLIMLDQYHIQGNLDLAWNLTLLTVPPAVRANSHKPIVSTPPTKSKAVGRAKFSTLVEDRVVMAALAEMKNYDSMAKLESGDA